MVNLDLAVAQVNQLACNNASFRQTLKEINDESIDILIVVY